MSQVEPRDSKRQLTLLAACLGFVVVILDVSVVNVATDALSQDFGASLSGLEWVINGYTLTFAACLLTSGALGDRFGPKRIFQVGFALFAVTSFACGASNTLMLLILFRIAQGVGAAVIVPSSLSIVNKTFPDQAERTKAVSMWAAAGGLALALGPVVGGVLISQFGWRSIFFVNLPVAAVGIWLTQTGAARTPARAPGQGRRSFDVPGQLLAIVGLGALTAAVIEANGLGWSSSLVEICLAVFVIALVGFVFAEKRSADPMLPLRLFSRKEFTSASLIGVLVNFSFYGLIFIFSLFFQKGWDYSPIATGLAFLPMTATIMIANLACGPLTKRYGVRAVLISGSTLAALGYLAMLPAVHSGSYLSIVVQFIIAGAGIGLVVPAITNAMLSAVDPGNAGIGSGVLNASRQFGGLIGVAVMGLLVGGVASETFLSGLQFALIAAAVALLVSALLSAFGIHQVSARTKAAAAPKPAPAKADAPELASEPRRARP